MSYRLDIRGLNKGFDGKPVLDDLSLTVRPGEFVSILGPSGAGKSTIFQILTGGLSADSGEVHFDGAPLGGKRDTFAFMPQRDALMPWRRVIDNTILGLEVQGFSRTAALAKVAPLFEPFGLAGAEQLWPTALSGGMRQRVSLLRTVVQDRPMLLLDEPFGALDALTRATMQRWLERMWDTHRWTALLITHDIREAIFLSDRIYVLSPRPAKIALMAEVPLSRPRSFRDLGSPEALALEARLIEALIPAEGSTDLADEIRPNPSI